MRIVHVAPDFIPVPPIAYGGIERVIGYLVNIQAKRGHEVFLYAMPGSRTEATLLAYQHQNNASEIANVVRNTCPSADIIHDHTHGSVIGRSHLPIPTVCTIHIPWWNPVKYPIFLNERMRSDLGKGKGYVVHSGVNLEQYPVCETKSDYLLFVGRLIPEKGIMHAIDMATATGRKLVIAGPMRDPVEPEKYQDFLNDLMPKMLKSDNIVYIGEVSDYEKVELLQHAECVLFPSDTEAFGLVMIEALACGTPVLALNNGAVPEVLEPFPELFGDALNDLVMRINKKQYPSPSALRKHVEQHFTADMMADRYLSIYEEILKIGSHRQ